MHRVCERDVVSGREDEGGRPDPQGEAHQRKGRLRQGYNQKRRERKRRKRREKVKREKKREVKKKVLVGQKKKWEDKK